MAIVGYNNLNSTIKYSGTTVTGSCGSSGSIGSAGLSGSVGVLGSLFAGSVGSLGSIISSDPYRAINSLQSSLKEIGKKMIDSGIDGNKVYSMLNFLSRFINGTVTLQETLEALKNNGINAKGTQNNANTVITFSYAGINCAFRQVTEPGKDCKLYTKEDLTNGSYSLPEKLINQYFNCVYTDSFNGKLYTLKANCGYASVQQLSLAIFEKYKEDLLLDNFLADKNRETNSAHYLSVKLENGGVITSTNYTQYIDEIGLAEGDDAKQLRDEALNKLIEDFTSGNLNTSQISYLLRAIGVSDKELTEDTNGMYKLSFKYDGNTYTLMCNKAAAEKSTDDIQQTTYTYEALLDIAGDKGIDEDVLQTYFIKSSSGIRGIDGRDSNVLPTVSYTLREGKTLESFKAANDASIYSNSTEGKWENFIASGSYDKLCSFLTGAEKLETEEMLTLYTEIADILNTKFTNSEGDMSIQYALKSSREVLMKSIYSSVVGREWNGNENTFVLDIVANADDTSTLRIIRDMDDVFHMSQTQKEELTGFMDNPESDELGLFIDKLYIVFDETLGSSDDAINEMSTTEGILCNDLYNVYKYQYGIDEETFKELYTLAGDYALNSDTAPGTVENSQEFFNFLEISCKLEDYYKYYKSENKDIQSDIINHIFKEGISNLLTPKALTTELSSLATALDTFINKALINYIFSDLTIEQQDTVVNQLDTQIAKRGLPSKVNKLPIEFPEGVKEKYTYQNTNVTIEIDLSNGIRKRFSDYYYLDTTMTVTTNGESYSIPIQGVIRPTENANGEILDCGTIIDSYLNHLTETVGNVPNIIRDDIYNEIDCIFIKNTCYNPYDPQKMDTAQGVFDHYSNTIQLSIDNISALSTKGSECSIFRAALLHELGHALDSFYTTIGTLEFHTTDLNSGEGYLSNEELRNIFNNLQELIKEDKKLKDRSYPVTSFNEFFAEYYAYLYTDGNSLYSDVIKKFIKLASDNEDFKKLKDAMDNSITKIREDKQTNHYSETEEDKYRGRKQAEVGTHSDSDNTNDLNCLETPFQTKDPYWGSDIPFAESALNTLNNFVQSVSWSGDWKKELDGSITMPTVTVTASSVVTSSNLGYDILMHKLADAGYDYRASQKIMCQLEDCLGIEKMYEIEDLIASGAIEVRIAETYDSYIEFQQKDLEKAKTEEEAKAAEATRLALLAEGKASPKNPEEFDSYLNAVFGDLYKTKENSYTDTMSSWQYTVVREADYLPDTPAQPTQTVTSRVYAYDNGRVTVRVAYSNGTSEEQDITNTLQNSVYYSALQKNKSLQYQDINSILKEFVKQQNELLGNDTNIHESFGHIGTT